MLSGGTPCRYKAYEVVDRYGQRADPCSIFHQVVFPVTIVDSLLVGVFDRAVVDFDVGADVDLYHDPDLRVPRGPEPVPIAG